MLAPNPAYELDRISAEHSASGHAPETHPFLQGGLDCTIIQRHASRPSDNAGIRVLLSLCDSTLRENVNASIHRAYMETYRELSAGTGTFTDAYVSFLRGEKYLELSVVSIRAVHAFSSRPILLFVAGDIGKDVTSIWPPSEYPRLIIIQMATGQLNPYFDKLCAAVLSPVEHGVIVEADTLITPQADRLFGTLRRYGHQVFPLMPGHEDVRWEDCDLYNGPKLCINPIPEFPHKYRSMDYVHAHLMWTSDSRPFLVDLLVKCSPGFEESGIDCMHDEMALNTALWKAGARRQLCLMDPYSEYMQIWEDQDTEKILHAYNRTMGFVFMHGTKDANVASAIVDRIASQRNKPWFVQNGEWYTNVDVGIHEGGCIL